jgi:hypothetical protein
VNSRVCGRTIGETFLVSRGERVRILAIDTEIDEELLDAGSSACSPSSGVAALLQLFAFVYPAGLVKAEIDAVRQARACGVSVSDLPPPSDLRVEWSDPD